MHSVSASVCFLPLGAGSEWSELHVSPHLLSFNHLRPTSYNMGLRDFLCVPKGLRRKRSKARSEIGPAEGPSDPCPVASRPAESAPDLRIGAFTSATPGPLMTREQEFNSMQTVPSRANYLTTLFATQAIPLFLMSFHLFSAIDTPRSLNHRILLPNRARKMSTRTNQTSHLLRRPEQSYSSVG